MVLTADAVFSYVSESAAALQRAVGGIQTVYEHTQKCEIAPDVIDAFGQCSEIGHGGSTAFAFAASSFARECAMLEAIDALRLFFAHRYSISSVT